MMHGSQPKRNVCSTNKAVKGRDDLWFIWWDLINNSCLDFTSWVLWNSQLDEYLDEGKRGRIKKVKALHSVAAKGIIERKHTRA